VYSIKTRCICGNPESVKHDDTGSVSVPVYISATFAHPALGESTGFDYSRVSNPTRTALEDVAASLDNAARGFAFSSGMAAVTALFDTFSSGDEIIASDDLYGGSVRLFSSIEKRNGVSVLSCDMTDLSQAEKLFTPKTKAVYIETPGNPTMSIIDIRKAASLAHAHGAVLIVDNTFLSPYFQQPLSLGADVVVQSGTKFLCGHNDVLAGIITTSNAELIEKISFVIKTTGAVLSPFDSWLVIRGIKTLAVRMEAQQKSAVRIASFLSSHSRVTRVLYPGLRNHPGYEINTSQASGSGSMISFHVDSASVAQRVLGNVKIIKFAESLGGVDSLITYPVTQTHADVPEPDRERKGITDTFLRLSVGLEDYNDLCADLEQALG
jgi:cystathionine gamma-synthase